MSNLKLGLTVLKNQIFSIFFILLLVAGLTSFYLGENTDAWVLIFILVINTFLGFIQEFRASKAGEKLQNLIKISCKVEINGEITIIDSDKLQIGNRVHFIAGDVIAADITVLEATNAFLDDSVRTGESKPEEVLNGGKLYAGSSVISGKVIGLVEVLPSHSALNKYKNKLDETTKDSTFQNFVTKISLAVFLITFFGVILVMCVVTFWLHTYEFNEFLIFAIAILVGVVPETLPLIITIILTKESLDLSKKKVIVKRLNSLQELGAVKFLLTDKTGTLTQNTLKIAEIIDFNQLSEICSKLCHQKYEQTPMDAVFDKACLDFFPKFENNQFKSKISNFEAFETKTGYAKFYFNSGQNIIRGRFEPVVKMCNLDVQKQAELLEKYQNFESKGLRVLAFAFQNNSENTWNLAGLLALEDPLKAGIESLLKQSEEKGVDVKILTGDSEIVANYIASKVGLVQNEFQVIDLEKIDLNSLSNEDLTKIQVFARCSPEDKLKLIERYLKLGPVAFLGEGINDALALKKADVGLAVNNASDVARQSADILLLKKSLQPILEGISMGRIAFNYIYTYLTCTLIGNIGTVFTLLTVAVFWHNLPMQPSQILLNNILTDIPLLFILTDNVDSKLLNIHPEYKFGGFIKKLVIFGVLSSIFDFIHFGLFYNQPLSIVQTSWFLLSVLAELALFINIRSTKPVWKSPALSKPLFVTLLFSVLTSVIFIYTPFLGQFFKFAPLSALDLAKIGLVISCYFCLNEVVKKVLFKVH